MEQRVQEEKEKGWKSANENDKPHIEVVEKTGISQGGVRPPGVHGSDWILVIVSFELCFMYFFSL